MNLTFFIPGHPVPGGSKSAFPVWQANGQIVTKRLMNGKQWPILRFVDAGGKAGEVWKAKCAVSARAVIREKPRLSGPLTVTFTFFMRRPQAHYRTGKFANLLRDDAPQYHTQAPDALKLARGTEDALTGVAWHDDSQTVSLTTEKRWAKPDEPEGCRVTIIAIDLPQPVKLTPPPSQPALL